MCQSIVYRGRHIETMSEARRILGDAHLVIADGGVTMDSLEGPNCLCPLDIHATAGLLRCRVARHDGDPMELHLEPIQRGGASHG